MAGCTPASRALLDVTPGLNTLHLRAGQPAATLNPRYRYLRLTVNGRPVMMILGFVDGPVGSPTEVWYSAASEVLRLRDAMVVGSAALPVNWLDVRYSAWPRWNESVQHFTRRVDVQPGYRFGLQQRLELRRVASPGARKLVGVDPRTLHWYALRDAATGHTDYYAAREQAGRPPEVIYGEQCLAAKLCLSWQHWPATR
jgi:hypothetical protein